MEKEKVASKGFSFRECICEKDLPKECPFAKEERFEIRDTFFGHRIGVTVGYKKGEELHSYFVSDKKGETSILQEMIESEIVESKIKNTKMKDEDDFSEKEYYYIIYKLADHSSMKPTCLRNIDFCMNTSHKVTYEVLLVDSDWEGVCRYLTFSYKTSGSFAMPFLSELSDLEEKFENMIENCTDGVIDCGDYNTFRMYDEFGEEVDIEIDGVNSLLRRVASIRLLEVKTETIEI